MIEIFKASAGSGKTHKLSNTYLKRLLGGGEEHPYRHILAVTFTNKATAEMKERILSDLAAKAGEGDARARRYMLEILHDYSAFAVSTIDRFFQKTLKAFSREVGYFSAYQVELDRDSLITEAMDRILDSLTEDDKELLEWVRKSVAEALEDGGRLSVDNALYEMGKRLKSEDHRKLAEEFGVDDREAYSKSRLLDIKRECARAIDEYVADVVKAANRVKNALSAAALDPGETSRGWLRAIDEFTDKKTVKSGNQPTEAFIRYCTNPDQWLAKKNQHLLPRFEEAIGTPLKDFRNLFVDNVRRTAFLSATLIKEHIFSLGLAGEFYKRYDQLLKEKNIMCLDESNVILRNIIDDTDAPFIYEKTGVRFNDFLLDEFQDTSNIQWENIRPLLAESTSRGGYSLIVGDVKQSIYRWRDSDWNLLASKAQNDFKEAVTDSLKANWRSSRAVLGFNLDFFRFAASRCDEIAPDGIGMKVAQLYEEPRLEGKSKEVQEGRVQISFREDQMEKITEIIEDARQRGARWKDIAILARTRAIGASIASFLVEKGYSIISDDSLSLKSSLAVRRTVSLLACLDNPDDSVNSYISRAMGIEYPKEYHSLVDLCEELLRGIRTVMDIQGDTLFLEAFMDELQSWVEVNGNGLKEFLRHWNENDFFIGTPDDADAIRIMTIHKSKGLEFPLVIFPFAEGVKLYHEDWRWCHLNTEGTGLDKCLDGIYPIKLNGRAEGTFFEHDLLVEKKMQIVDNLNVTYVALTRAMKELYVISRPANKTVQTIADILHEYVGGTDEFSSGEPYDYSRMERKPGRTPEILDAGYPSFSAEGRFKASTDAADFFGEDGTTGPDASARRCGIVQHDILASVNRPEDLRGAVDEAVLSGAITADQGERYFLELSQAIDDHRDWFSGDKSFNETSIIGDDGLWHRPDRVIVNGEAVTVIDYKFGTERPSYRRQVSKYMELYRKMGHDNVRGYVWLVPERKVIEV